MTLRELVVKLGIETDEKKIKSFETKLKDVKKVMANVGKVALGITGALAGIGAGAFALTNQVTKTGDAIAKLSKDLNISGESLQEWSYLSGLAGVSTQDLNGNLTFFNRQLMEATKTGTGKTADWLNQLGISMRDNNGAVKDQNTLLMELSHAFEGIKDPAVKTTIALDLFGRSGGRMAQVLGMGTAEIEKLKLEAKDLGAVLSEETLQASETFQDSLTRLTTVFAGIKNELGSALIPLMNVFVETLTEIGKELKGVLTPFIKSFTNVLSPIMGMLINLIKTAMNLLIPVLDILVKVIDMLMPLFEPVFKLLDVLIKFIADLLPAILDPLMELIDMMLKLLIPILNDLIDLIAVLFEPLIPVIKIVMNILMVMLKQALLPFLVVLKLLSLVLQPVIQLLSAVFRVLTPILNVFEWLTAVANYFMDVLIKLLFDVMGKGFNKIKEIIFAFGRTFRDVFTAIPQFIQQMWGYFEGFIDFVAKRFPLVGEIFAKIKDVFGDIVFTVKKWFAEMINWVIKKINWAIEKMNMILPDKLKMKLIQALDVENEVIRQAEATRTYNTTNFQSQSTFNISAGGGTAGDIQTAVQESARALFQLELKKLVINAGY
jgi:phage-related protein